VTHDSRSYQIRFFVVPSKKNGLLQEIFAVLNSGQLPAFSPIFLKVAGPVIEHMYAALIDRILKRESEEAVAIDAIRDIALAHSEFASQVHHGQMRDKAWLQGTVDKLVSENRAPIRQIPEPVGRTVREMLIGASDLIVIDEPSAEVLRSRAELEVGEEDHYNVKIEGVFKTNGACRVRLIDRGEIVPGKVTDPALSERDNIYTRALNDGTPLRVTAKPTLKDGRIYRLFISDASLLS
jgi:hypothetical protein